MGGRAGGGSGMGSGVRGGDASMRHLSAAAQRALKSTEDSIRDKDVEWGAVLDDKGNVIWQGTDNHPSHIYWRAPIKDRIVTHNHPSKDKGKERADNGGSFSKTDLMTAANYDVSEMRAVTGKYSFSIKRPATGWHKGGWENGKFYSTNANAYKRAKDRVDRRIKKYYEATKKDWKTAGHRVSATYWHLVNKEYAKIQGYTYTKTKIK